MGNICYYTFNDRSVVSFVSNVFQEAMDERVARLPPHSNTLTYQSVPPVLPAYNKYMGAVDRLSQLRKTYGFDRKSKRYWIRGFMTFFDYAVVNAYILYKQSCSKYGVKVVSPLEFRLNLVHLLMTEGKRRVRVSVHGGLDTGGSRGVCTLVRIRDVETGSSEPELRRGRCVYCKSGHTTFACSSCKVRLCKIPCYHAYHQVR